MPEIKLSFPQSPKPSVKDTVLTTLTRPGIPQDVYLATNPAQPHVLQYILPNNSIGGRTAFLRSVADAAKINAHIAMRLLEMPGVEMLTLMSKQQPGQPMRDAISIRFRDGVNPASHRATLDNIMFEIAANMDKNNFPKNPKFSLYPGVPQMDQDSINRFYEGHLPRVRQGNPTASEGVVRNIAMVKAVLDEFRERAVKVHQGNIKLEDIDLADKRADVSLSQVCGTCVGGQKNTLETLTAVLRNEVGSVIQHVRLVPAT